MNNKHYSLESEFKKLSEAYKTVAEEYEAKITKLTTEYETYIESVEKRNSYEINL